MNHEEEISFHENGADFPTWALAMILIAFAAVLTLAAFLIVYLPEVSA